MPTADSRNVLAHAADQIRGVVLRTVRLYNQIDGEQRAAAFAYYVLFSLFPLMALILSVGSLFFAPSDLTDAIGAVLPLEADQQKFLWEAVEALERRRGGVGLVSLAILLWCSLRFFQALVRGVNRAWHTVEIPWWQMPLKNMLMVGVIGSALFAGVLIPALLQGAVKALNAASDFLHQTFPMFNFTMASQVMDLARYLLGAGVLFYSFCILFILAPRKRVPFRHVWFPALAVTLALQACQMAFVSYLPLIVNYGLYGAVGGMMLVLMWVYFSGIIIMLGACLSASLGGGPVAHPAKSDNNLEQTDRA
ncbi:MAG: YihY/virulence factor BrkB family protein [Terrimicrobiaceae bacterium]